MRVFRQFCLESRMDIAYPDLVLHELRYNFTAESPLRRQNSARIQRVSAKSCLSEASSFGRSECTLNFGNPKGGVVGTPSFGYFSWQDKKSDLPPGNPRQISHTTRVAPKRRYGARRLPHPNPPPLMRERGLMQTAARNLA
jgi:hypothetical protein